MDVGATNMSIGFRNTSENCCRADGNSSRSWDDKENYDEYQAGQIMYTYIFPLVYALGFFGNPLSIFVNYRRFYVSSPHLYMTILAVWDLMFLFFEVIYEYRDKTGLTMGDSGCKIFYFALAYSSHCAVWILVALTSERFVALWLPWKMNTPSAFSRARTTAIVICVVLLGLDLHAFWSCHAVASNGVVYCRWKSEYKIVLDWLDHIVYSFAPFLLILALNIMIIIGINKRAKSHAKLTSSHHRDSSESCTQRQITVMLLTVSMTFAALTAPKCIYSLVTRYFRTMNSEVPVTGKQKAVSNLFFMTFNMMESIQHSINFYLYFLSGRTFRKELRELGSIFCSKQEVVHNNNVHYTRAVTCTET